MAVGFDRWFILKVLQFLFVLACLVCKRVTDDEESRLFLYLQKLSREWPFLNSITWDRIGSAVADAVYGGYLIITLGMVLGKAMREIPTKHRAMERLFLGLGAILFIVLGGLEFAALDSVPPDLVDNAAVLGTLSIIAGILFLMDLAAPRLKDSNKQSQTAAHLQLKPLDLTPVLHEMENGSFRETPLNGHTRNEAELPAELPIEMEKHSPVFSRVNRPYYGQYDNVSPTYLRFQTDIEAPPSTPGDPGYVQYTAKKWGQASQKTPRNSPTEV
ncbi:uncharacterized protein CBL_09416 [Carabus blaptoides fortunei]